MVGSLERRLNRLGIASDFKGCRLDIKIKKGCRLDILKVLGCMLDICRNSKDHKLKIKGLDDIKVGDFRRKELDP
jgi:hypothetical protein